MVKKAANFAGQFHACLSGTVDHVRWAKQFRVAANLFTNVQLSSGGGSSVGEPLT
jgi:hypothetical protein